VSLLTYSSIFVKSWDAPEDEVSKISSDSLKGIYIYKVSLSDYENDYDIICYRDGLRLIWFDGKSQSAFGFGLEIPNNMSDMLRLNFISFRGVEEFVFFFLKFPSLFAKTKISDFFMSFETVYLWRL